jgi:membrane protein
MARLQDVPVVLRTVGPVPFGKRIVREVLDDNLFTLAGGLAYSWLFAIFPFLVFLMNLFPLLYSKTEEAEETKAGMEVFLRAALPDPAADMLWNHMSTRIDAIIRDPSKSIATVSLLIALWAASKGIGVTMAAMEKCYELEKGRAFYTRRPVAFALTVTVSVLVLLLVLLLPAGAAFKNWAISQGEHVGFWGMLAFDVVRGLLAIAVVLLILALFYHFGPGVRHRWRYITPGSVFVLTTWVLVGVLFRYYVNHFGKSKYEETYGSVGGAAILLLLFYIDALVLLIGAQINSEIDFDVLQIPRGSRNFLAAERRAGAAPPGDDDGDGTLDDDAIGEMMYSHGAD